jgi:ABC-type antimicrobial peptide transport system permease subunit
LEWPGKDPGLKADFVHIATEYDYTQTLGIPLLQGRDFSRDFKSDSSAIVINEAAADLMGLQEPVGTQVKWNDATYTIIGVMQNVVMGDPYQPVGPLMMAFNPGYSSTITLRVNPEANLSEATATIERIFRKFNPAFPFEFRFADDEFNRKFSSLQLISQLAGWFSALAIVITCLGLFGLAAFTAEQRAKEVGIRKILGASVANVVMLISKDFSRLVIVALVLAFPLVWWASQRFLEGYAYRIETPWWVAPAVGLGTLVLALAVVSTQAWKAAVANPVDSLRSE